MSSVPPNIERFNLTTLALLNHLYDNFPSEVSINTATLGAETAARAGMEDQAAVFAMHADDVVTWLKEEGFIRVGMASFGTDFHQVRLSLRGLTILGYVPSAVSASEPAEPFIRKIKNVFAKGAEKAAAEAAGSIVSGLFKAAIAYAVSPSGSGVISA